MSAAIHFADPHAPLPPAVLTQWLQRSGATALLRLHLGATNSVLRMERSTAADPSASQAAAPAWLPLPLGLEVLVQHCFAQRMPNAAQLEHAIMQVEDAIMPMAPHIPAHSVMLLDDPLLRDIGLRALGHSTADRLQTEAVESLFEQLARQAAHPQIARHGVPQTPQGAAALLILRELLHHWQLHTVYLADQPSG